MRQWMQRQKFNDPVPGTFEVHSTSDGAQVDAHVDLSANGLLSIPGLGVLPGEFRGKVPHAKRPVVGQVLPVIVDRANPTQFRIEWDQVPTVTVRVEHEAGIPANLTTSNVHAGPISTEVHTHPVAPDWEAATAKVRTCHSARVPAFAASQAPGGIVDLILDVRLADGYEYSTKTRVAFSTMERRAKATAKDTELPIRVDPADRSRVVIDIDRIPHW